MARAAIFGIGNVLMGDDGVGPAVARFLHSHFDFPDDVVVEDLGTPSLDLPSYLVDRDLVIFVDAVSADAPAGTIRAYTREQIVAVTPGLRISQHEPTINDALIVLDFAGNAPSDVVLIGVVPQSLDGGVALSPAVADAVPRAAEAVIAELEKRGVRMNRRDTRMQNAECRIENEEMNRHRGGRFSSFCILHSAFCILAPW